MKGYKKATAARLRRNDAGLTLIEIMFASGVLATAVGIMFGALITLAVTGDIAEGRTRATTGMASVMEGIRASNLDVLTQTPAPVVVDGHTMAVTLEAVGSDGNPVTLPLESAINNLPNPVEIRVTLIWQDRRGRMYTSRAATMIGL